LQFENKKFVSYMLTGVWLSAFGKADFEQHCGLPGSARLTPNPKTDRSLPLFLNAQLFYANSLTYQHCSPTTTARHSLGDLNFTSRMFFSATGLTTENDGNVFPAQSVTKRGKTFFFKSKIRRPQTRRLFRIFYFTARPAPFVNPLGNKLNRIPGTIGD
jgi:hypothetical protein